MAIVLVADDNPVSLHFFADALAAHGMHCVAAENGRVAIALACERHFDLLLLDARMPYYSGAETLALIRARQGLSHSSPAVATTAGDPCSHANLLKQGFAEVLAKPTTLVDVGAMLARQLRGFTVAEAATATTSMADEHAALLDDDRALLSSGGDVGIMLALRGLLVTELQTLACECADLGRRRDRNGLTDRLHRLDASAGFCGTPALARAVQQLRAELDQASAWPDMAINEFLQTATSTLQALRDQSESTSREGVE
ncbi:MAG: response regulator [Dokdonella sp.]